jgi:hypothetical protein
MSNGEKDKEQEMEQKREEIADKIITEMTESGASQSDIEQQKKTNKDLLGHEGEFK